MLIDGKKWACEACIRGHRVTSCKHHDRPLIRIKRKGRPFATCTMCNATPCTAPSEHARAKRDAELKCPKKASNARHYPRNHSTNGFLPIAPRPGPGPGSAAVSRSSSVNEKTSTTAATKLKSRSGSRQDFAETLPSRSASTASAKTPAYHDAVGAGDWSGSEGSFSGCESSGRTVSFSASRIPGSESSLNLHAVQDSPLPKSAPGSLCDYPIFTGAEATNAANVLFDSAYTLLPSTSAVSSEQTQTLPMVSPLENVNPFEFPLDPTLALGFGELGELEDMNMDLGMPIVEGAFHVEDWSRYMWSAETGFEHLDTGFPVSQ
ncbi:unnamed protein product [Penicillium salamii]|uniref:Copper-fist domain-containing protein n=1 Tax=Penicillium salamii TaxID=1612424 RepID=A0A9W4NK70_9EURO|nr:unnamed protein product [Penicillium salamii]CAG7980471.1 unnamed protein product [Penicillium salamii]CAG8078553.1 unnamed protein product [Penicillium salamii]CAG8082097.1 unnamed protein product [Penicillium salamii]CAG8238075.1 unnamed protein product [Penicillium salamii]